jgi:RNA polymerase sigma-70 factor (ECF subfamily)
MGHGQVSPVLRFIRQLARPRDAGAADDAALLEAFVYRHDEGAFAALVRRHGPMVLGVCRRILRHEQDAEDAFQATFLVLARRAGDIRRPERLGNWLYGVACRTAARARRMAARRRNHERQAAAAPATSPVEAVLWQDLRPVLDEEIRRLPERYRAPFVLHYLEGRTNQEAARQLGCPEGTVLSRLAWARQRLRRRLALRGIGLTAGGVALALSEKPLAAAGPTALAAVTVRAGLDYATGQIALTGVSTQVLAMTKGVLRAMWMTRLKIAAAVLLSLGGVASGVGFGVRASLAAGEGRGAAGAAAAVIAREDGDKKDKEITVKGLPPVVVRTAPRAGDTSVDAAAVKEIRVTFSKDMAADSWSWSQISDETFPKVDGKPHYAKDRRTCVLPVQLEAGKTYVIWLNSEKFGNFKDADGRSAVPYLLVFETKP